MHRADFVVRLSGSIITFDTISAAARQFVAENVDVPSWAWMGTNTFCADHRPGALLVAALDDHGFTITFR